MLNIRGLFIGLLVVLTLLISGCSEKEQKVITLDILKQNGFVVNPKFQPPVEILGAESGWNGTLNKIKVTVMLYATEDKANTAVDTYEELALDGSNICSIYNMTLTTDSKPCENLVGIFK